MEKYLRDLVLEFLENTEGETFELLETDIIKASNLLNSFLLFHGIE